MTIIRKRVIPPEEVDISDDEMLYRNDYVIITRWKPIRPRNDLGWGISYTSLFENYKVSAFFNNLNEFLYWYVDIIKVTYVKEQDMYIIKDLLLDIKILPGMNPELLDMDELEFSYNNSLITLSEKDMALNTANRLLKQYSEGIPGYIIEILKYGPPRS